MKKILLLCLLGLTSYVYASEPNPPPVPDTTNAKIISSQNFFITKSYDESVVPQELKKWNSWVNKDNYTQNCVENFCVFIPKLTVNKNQGYRFIFEGSSLSNSTYVPLPSSSSVWPLSVTVNGHKAIIVNQQDQPFVRIDKGDFTIQVQYTSSIFDKSSSFNLPFNVVSFDNTTGQNISLKDSVLSLNDINKVEEQSNFTEIKVFRKFVDTIPYQLHTNIDINYSGKIKELDLGQVLPEEFKLTQINSDLKVVYKNNHYYATVTSGTHFINFNSFANKEINSFAVKNLVLNVDNEIWSVQKNNNIRNIDISSASIVDPKQVNVPEEWKSLPAYMVVDKFDIISTQQGISYNLDLKINASRQSLFGFNNTVYHLDTFNFTNVNSKKIDFYPGIDILSVNMSQPKMILQEKNHSYVLLNSQDQNGYVQFDTLKGHSIASQLSDNYFLEGWTTYFTPRTDLIWANNATVTSPDFWFNAWNLYSLFSLSVLIIALYKLMGIETAICALFSLFSFYYNNSIFWIFWLLFVISFAFNKHLSEKYANFKRNTHQVSLLGTFLVIIFTIEFVANEIFSIMHPNIAHRLSFSPTSSILLLTLLLLVYKIVNKIKSRKPNYKKRQLGWLGWCALGLVCLSLPYLFSTSTSTSLGGASYSSNEIGVAAAPAAEPLQQSVQVSAEPGSVKAVPGSSNISGVIAQQADNAKTLNEIALRQENQIVAKSSIVRNISQEKVQVGHELLPVNHLHSYTLKSDNKQSVDFYVADKWLINVYGIFQCVFLILFTYLLIVYYLLVFHKQEVLQKLPAFLSDNMLVKKIKSKIIEA